MHIKSYIVIYLPIIGLGVLMVAFPDKLVFFITDIILYVLAAYHIFLYFRTRRTIIRRFPDYYSSIFTYRYLKGPEHFIINTKAL